MSTPEFLSAEWFDWINELLASVPRDDDLFVERTPVRVVFELLDGPSHLPHALTFTLDTPGASIAAGDHLAADLIVSLSYNNARELSSGQLEGALALREGRLKVRGDVNALVPFGLWMVAAQNNIVGRTQTNS